MQIPPSQPIPTFPDETNPGPVPPMGPGTVEPDEDDDEDDPFIEDDPGDEPAFPPVPDPFPDDVNLPPDNI